MAKLFTLPATVKPDATMQQMFALRARQQCKPGVSRVLLFTECFALAADLVPQTLHVHVAAVCSFQHLLGTGSSTRRKHAAQQV